MSDVVIFVFGCVVSLVVVAVTVLLLAGAARASEE